MRDIPAQLLLKAQKQKAPGIFMSATLTELETKQLINIFDIRNSIVVKSSPVLANHFFANLKRPKNSCDILEVASGNGDEAKNLIDLLNLVLIDRFVDSFKESVLNSASN